MCCCLGTTFLTTGTMFVPEQSAWVFGSAWHTPTRAQLIIGTLYIKVYVWDVETLGWGFYTRHRKEGILGRQVKGETTVLCRHRGSILHRRVMLYNRKKTDREGQAKPRADHHDGFVFSLSWPPDYSYTQHQQVHVQPCFFLLSYRYNLLHMYSAIQRQRTVSAKTPNWESTNYI